MPEKEQDWYFTFGGDHKHPDGYVKIHGTFGGAREVMFSYFGPKWAFQYDEKQFIPQIRKYGLYEVVLQ